MSFLVNIWVNVNKKHLCFPISSKKCLYSSKKKDKGRKKLLSLRQLVIYFLYLAIELSVMFVKMPPLAWSRCINMIRMGLVALNYAEGYAYKNTHIKWFFMTAWHLNIPFINSITSECTNNKLHWFDVVLAWRSEGKEMNRVSSVSLIDSQTGRHPAAGGSSGPQDDWGSSQCLWGFEEFGVWQGQWWEQSDPEELRGDSCFGSSATKDWRSWDKRTGHR